MGVEVAQVVRRDDAELGAAAGRQPEVGGDLVAVVGQQLGQHVVAVDPDRALPGEVVEPDVVEADLASGATPSMRANRRWKPIATLHSPIARCARPAAARG